MDEFIVDRDKVHRLLTFKDKIERFYNVIIRFDSVFTDSDNTKAKQWVQVEGEISDRRNAKVSNRRITFSAPSRPLGHSAIVVFVSIQ